MSTDSVLGRAIRMYLSDKVGGNFMLDLPTILQKDNNDRTQREFDYLVRKFCSYTFVKSRKFKEKDVREMAAKVDYASFKVNENVYECGHKSEQFYIITQGECEVWVPVWHHTMKTIVKDYLRELDRFSQTSSDFYTPIIDGKIVTERDWVQEQFGKEVNYLDHRKDWRRYIQKESKEVMRDAAIYIGRAPRWGMKDDGREPIDQPPLGVHQYNSNMNFQGLLQHTATSSNNFGKSSRHFDFDIENCQMDIPNHFFSFNGSRYFFKNGIYFEHISTLKQGEAFGEIQSHRGRRQATVTVTSRKLECATLSNHFYKRLVDKVDQKRLDDLLDFLMPVQCFKSHSRNAVSKFTNYLHKVKFKRNQLVYSQNQKATKVYIVWKGQFLATKQEPKPINTEDKKMTEMLGFKLQKHNVFQKQLPEIADPPLTHQLAVYGSGSMIAEDDAFQRLREYTCEVRCYSAKGVLFEMKREDFYRLLMERDTQQAVRQVVMHKNVHKEGKDLCHNQKEAAAGIQKKRKVYAQSTDVQKSTHDLQQVQLPVRKAIEANDISILDPAKFIHKQRQKKLTEETKKLQKLTQQQSQQQRPVSRNSQSLFEPQSHQAAFIESQDTSILQQRNTPKLQTSCLRLPSNLTPNLQTEAQYLISDRSLFTQTDQNIVTGCASVMNREPQIAFSVYGSYLESTKFKAASTFRKKSTVVQSISQSFDQQPQQQTSRLSFCSNKPVQEDLANFGKTAIWSNKFNGCELLKKKREVLNPLAMSYDATTTPSVVASAAAAVATEEDYKERRGSLKLKQQDEFSPIRQRLNSVMMKIKQIKNSEE